MVFGDPFNIDRLAWAENRIEALFTLYFLALLVQALSVNTIRARTITPIFLPLAS